MRSTSPRSTSTATVTEEDDGGGNDQCGGNDRGEKGDDFAQSGCCGDGAVFGDKIAGSKERGQTSSDTCMVCKQPMPVPAGIGTIFI